MSGDEAVRKELLTAGMAERLIRERFMKHGDMARIDNILAEFRSAAIQECVNLIRVVDPQFVLTDALSALDAPLALKER